MHNKIFHFLVFLMSLAYSKKLEFRGTAAKSLHFASTHHRCHSPLWMPRPELREALKPSCTEDAEEPESQV